jgi:hypothetical protein
MATYEELFNLGTNTDLRNKVVSAVLIKADAISALSTPTQLQIDWAKEAFGSPIATGEVIYRAVIAANKGATVANITGASDAAIQTNVDDAVDNIYTKAGG